MIKATRKEGYLGFVRRGWQWGEAGRLLLQPGPQRGESGAGGRATLDLGGFLKAAIFCFCAELG